MKRGTRMPEICAHLTYIPQKIYYYSAVIDVEYIWYVSDYVFVNYFFQLSLSSIFVLLLFFDVISKQYIKLGRENIIDHVYNRLKLHLWN